MKLYSDCEHWHCTYRCCVYNLIINPSLSYVCFRASKTSSTPTRCHSRRNSPSILSSRLSRHKWNRQKSREMFFALCAAPTTTIWRRRRRPAAHWLLLVGAWLGLAAKDWIAAAHFKCLLLACLDGWAAVRRRLQHAFGNVSRCNVVRVSQFRTHHRVFIMRLWFSSTTHPHTKPINHDANDDRTSIHKWHRKSWIIKHTHMLYWKEYLAKVGVKIIFMRKIFLNYFRDKKNISKKNKLLGGKGILWKKYSSIL